MIVIVYLSDLQQHNSLHLIKLCFIKDTGKVTQNMNKRLFAFLGPKHLLVGLLQSYWENQNLHLGIQVPMAEAIWLKNFTEQGDYGQSESLLWSLDFQVWVNVHESWMVRGLFLLAPFPFCQSKLKPSTWKEQWLDSFYINYFQDLKRFIYRPNYCLWKYIKVL